MIEEKKLNEKLRNVNKDLGIVEYLNELADIKESYNRKEGFESFGDISTNTDDYIAMRRVVKLIEHLER